MDGYRRDEGGDLLARGQEELLRVARKEVQLSIALRAPTGVGVLRSSASDDNAGWSMAKDDGWNSTHALSVGGGITAALRLAGDLLTLDSMMPSA